MKIFFSLFLLLFIGALRQITPSDAAFVSYTDTRGKIHYVNTDYTKVPDQYLSQVEEQLKKIEAAKAKTVAIDNSNPINPLNLNKNQRPLNQTDDKNPLIEVFIKADCIDCIRLQTLLDANKIQYLTYDVEKSELGINFYKTQNNAQLPITQIGTKIIYGNDIFAVKAALTSQSTLLAPPTNTSAAAVETTPAPAAQTSQTPPMTNNSYGGYAPGEYFKINHLLKSNP